MDTAVLPAADAPLVVVDRVRQIYPKGGGDVLVLDDVTLDARRQRDRLVCSAVRAAASPPCCASSPA